MSPFAKSQSQPQFRLRRRNHKAPGECTRPTEPRRDQLAGLDALFASFQHRAFRREL